MTTLAPKLPWQHAFAGGFNRLGGQALPTDADAIDYLQRVAVADGAGVQVGIAIAVDNFVKGCKADGIWDAIVASCLLCGPRTIAGALVPLKGVAPTAYNFVSADYNQETGLKGDGATKYLNSNRAATADAATDSHLSVYVSTFPTTVASFPLLIGAIPHHVGFYATNSKPYSRSHSTTVDLFGLASPTGLIAISRSSPAAYVGHSGGVDYPITRSADASQNAYSHFVFGGATAGGSVERITDARLSFYSIGSACNLAALDARTSHLMNSIRFTLLTGLSPAGYDPATLAYLLAAYTAGGSLA